MIESVLSTLETSPSCVRLHGSLRFSRPIPKRVANAIMRRLSRNCLIDPGLRLEQTSDTLAYELSPYAMIEFGDDDDALDRHAAVLRTATTVLLRFGLLQDGVTMKFSRPRGMIPAQRTHSRTVEVRVRRHHGVSLLPGGHETAVRSVIMTFEAGDLPAEVREAVRESFLGSSVTSELNVGWRVLGFALASRYDSPANAYEAMLRLEAAVREVFTLRFGPSVTVEFCHPLAA